MKVLQYAIDKAIKEVWQQAVLLQEMDGRGNAIMDTGPPLDTSIIHWQPSNRGITFLELFRGIATKLVTILQACVKVRRFLYVDNDVLAKKAAICHIEKLKK